MGSSQRLFTVSEDADTRLRYTWRQMLDANEDSFIKGDILALYSLMVGHSLSFGGGAASVVTVTRVQ